MALTGLTPQMMAAARDGDAEDVLAILGEGVDPNGSNAIGQTSLHVAAIWGHANVARVLINNGASVDLVNNDGQSPLWFAVRNDKIEFVKVLIEKGAKVNKLPKNLLDITSPEMKALLRTGQMGSMHTAIKQNDLAKLQTLIDEGAGHMSDTDSFGRCRRRRPR